uniref:Serine/threonine-protein phosphatase 1 regulatory subunit 10 n=1 Tax=Meloidogyne incognita TaxID=6306 RepID=A0A914MU81_MELIC
MDEQAFLNQQMRGNVQYNVNQSHQLQQSHEQQLYQQQHQGRQPIYHQQNVNYQKGYDGGAQYNHGNEQQPLYNQQSYQMGYNQQQAVSTQYYTIPDDDDSIIVAENCIVMTSDPSPEQLMASQSSIGAHYPPEQQQTSRYPYLPSISDGVPSSTFYGQARQQQQQHREPHYVVVDPLTYSAGFQQIHSQQSTHKQAPQRQILRSSLPIQQVQRRAAPFEEEEEEMEGSDEDDEWQQEELVQTTSQQRYKININEPRMTRAARRKQNFESKSKPEKQKKVDVPKKMCSDIFSDEVEKSDNSVQKYEKKTISGTWAAVSPKKEVLAEKPLFDKNIAHIQAVQRLSTAEGWRRMNEWLKSSIKTMDLPKLRQLLAQLVDADITVELLRDNDTPKIVKDLQKCADKEIANFANKMVTKWKQTIRDGNKEKQLKLQQQQHQETKVKAQKPSGVGVAAVSGKNVKRASTESDVGDGPSTSQTSGQLKPRTGSISSAATSHQQQIGSRSNSFNVQNTTTGLNKTGESFVSALPKPERPKTIAKAKAKISRPRLTGLEGDESAATVNKSVERSIGTNKTKTSTTVVSSKTASTSTTAASANETPLARIMAATAKFHAEQQPKRKSVEVVFSDNFMDSLSAADVAKPKKAKIVRKKLSEQKDDSAKSDVRDSFAPVDENENNSEGFLTKKRVRFFDEIGRDLVDVRFFEVEEGERINVSKMGGMDKEAIKHLDSQREKQFLLDARRHGFGSTAPTAGGGYSSVIMDPSLMPPGHGRMFVDQTRPGGTSNSFKVPETRYPWRFMSVECQTIINIEPGCRSESKGIEYERQRTILPALVLPTALPVSDIDANELKQQREEGMMQMPKIIPLELVTEGPQKLTIEENNEEEESEIKLEALKIDLSPKKKLGMEGRREEMLVDETESKLEDYEVYENEALRSPSPERPPVCQIPSSDEDSRDDIKEIKDSIKENDQLDSQDNDGGIASPEPEQLNESFTDSGSSSIKEIPTEQLPSSRDLDDEDEKEDLDIRDQQQKLQQPPKSSTIPLSTSTSLLSTPTLSSSNLQAFKKIPNLNSLLQKISTYVGVENMTGTSSTTLTSSITSSAIEPKGTNDSTLGGSIAEASKVLASDKVQGDASEKQLQRTKTSIPPPPAPLYPSHHLAIGHPLPGSTFQSTFLPARMTMPATAIPPFQQINNTIFPPSDFSVPPPPIPGVRYGFNSGQRMPVDGVQQKNSTQTNVQSTIEKQDEKSPETAEGQRRQISPGPPGLDEGGSPPPSLEQQQQKSPSSVQVPQSIQQPFSSVSPSIMINKQQQQPNLPSRQISLEEAKEIAGVCQFYKRTGTCNFGERCKFAHDDEHLTFGVQMAMRGVSMPNRGGFRGSRGGGNSVGRAGGARDSPKVDTEGGSARFEKRTSRRAAGSDSNGRRLDYDISPVRGGGSEDTSVKGNRDRRYRRTSPQRRRGHSRSRSRDRYSRRRRSRSRNGRRRAKSSSSSSSSRSASSVSRSSTPQKDRDRKRSRSRTPTRRRRDYSRQRYRRDYYRRRSPPRHRSSSSSSNRRRRRSSSSSSSASQERKRNNKVKNSCDTDSGSPILVLSDETVRGEKNNVTASDSLPMEENKE